MLQKIKQLFRINWYRTLQLNFRLLPISQARRLPVVVCGPLRVESLVGTLQLPTNAGFGTLMIGTYHETYKAEAGKAQLTLKGKWHIQGRVRIGVDCCLYIAQSAELTMGDGCYIGRDSQFHCFGQTYFGNRVRAGEIYVTDSASHFIVVDGVQKPLVGKITVGSDTYISSKVLLLKGTVIPPASVIGAGAVCTRDFVDAEGRENVRELFIVGSPAYVKSRGVHAE